MGLAAGLLDNRTVLGKADLALADLTAGGGLLQPAQAQKFIRILIDESVILKQGTVVPMKSPKCVFRPMAITDSGASRSLIPIDRDHRFRPSRSPCNTERMIG